MDDAVDFFLSELPTEVDGLPELEPPEPSPEPDAAGAGLADFSPDSDFSLRSDFSDVAPAPLALLSTLLSVR